MKTIKYIIFDLGNVLVNIHPRETMQALALRCGKDVSEIQSLFLSEAHNGFMDGSLTPEQFHRNFSEEYRCNISFDEFITTWNRLIGTAKEGIDEIVEQLAANFTLAVCSNTDPLHWEIARQTLPFLNRFDHYFLSFEMQRLKPDPLMFQRVLSSLKAGAEQCVFIDDTEENILRAKALGFRVIHASESKSIRSELSRLNMIPPPELSHE